MLFEKVMISKKEVIIFLAVICNATCNQHEEIHVADVPRDLST